MGITATNNPPRGGRLDHAVPDTERSFHLAPSSPEGIHSMSENDSHSHNRSPEAAGNDSHSRNRSPEAAGNTER